MSLFANGAKHTSTVHVVNLDISNALQTKSVRSAAAETFFFNAHRKNDLTSIRKGVPSLMQHQRRAFVIAPPLRVFSKIRKVGICSQSRVSYVRFQCVAVTNPNSSADLPVEFNADTNQRSINENRLALFLKQLRTVHADLQSGHPPDYPFIEEVLLSLKKECLAIQGNVGRSLPGMSHLDRTIEAVRDESTTSQQLARLLRPTGALRTLCGAATAAHRQFQNSVESGALDVEAPASLRAAHDVVAWHASLRLRRSAKLRNASWRALQWEAMRAHPSFVELPETAALHVETPDQLQLLSQDGKAFALSRSLFPIRADTIWKVLGFGEDDVASKLGDLMPQTHRGHKHVLEMWQSFFQEGSGKKPSFAEEYHKNHIPNAILSYLVASKDKFDQEFSGRAQWIFPIQIREMGLAVGKVGGGQIIAAAPIGRVLRRRKEDYWAWGRQGDALVLVHTEMPFSGSGSGCDFGVLKPRRRLDVVSFLEAQMSMLVCGEQYRAADVVWHSVLGGTRTFRVNRDEKMLEVVVDEVEAFCERFVGERPRPPERGFAEGRLHDELVEMVRVGCAGVEVVDEVAAEVDEMRMERYREGMRDWDRGSRERPFWRAKRERG